MNGIRHRNRVSLRDLVALADGSLSAARRASVERRVSASQQLLDDVAAERRVLVAIRGTGAAPIPTAARARIELARDPHPERRRWHRLSAAAATGAVSAAAVASAAVLSLGGAAAAPTVAAAATFGTRAALLPTGGDLPGVSAAGIAFPDWTYRFGMHAVGARRDTLSGRMATTVFYVRGGERVAYTIVSGAPIPAGASTSSAVWSGVRLSSFSAAGRAVVTWQRDGHTCVLSGPGAMLERMMGLAAWGSGEDSSSQHAAGTYSS